MVIQDFMSDAKYHSVPLWLQAISLSDLVLQCNWDRAF